MAITNKLLLKIEEYIKENYVPEAEDLEDVCYGAKIRISGAFEDEDSGYFEGAHGALDDSELKKRVAQNLEDSWQSAMFNLIDRKNLNEVEVYKRAGITKQTFSKIRSDSDYHPDKDTAIKVCIGLQLNIDEALDLLSKAGYTLSKSILRDVVISCLIENKVYNIMDVDSALYHCDCKTLSKF